VSVDPQRDLAVLEERRLEGAKDLFGDGDLALLVGQLTPHRVRASKMI